MLLLCWQHVQRLCCCTHLRLLLRCLLSLLLEFLLQLLLLFRQQQRVSVKHQGLPCITEWRWQQSAAAAVTLLLLL